MGFGGFPRECLEFYQDLASNNNRQWFADNKDRFDETVMEPARQFVVDMGRRLAPVFPGIVAQPKVNKSIFRINRDTRFSRDKSPYKTHLGLWFWQGPGKRMESSGFYFHLEPGRLMLGAGLYKFPKHLLEEGPFGSGASTTSAFPPASRPTGPGPTCSATTGCPWPLRPNRPLNCIQGRQLTTALTSIRPWRRCTAG
ncbi:MAG: DUF2461 domain-containing protein [Deltaproteobacteria bacterium]|nr:DUF2461 domain-containing protein [Deltaproteobacteria bacterium]